MKKIGLWISLALLSTIYGCGGGGGSGTQTPAAAAETCRGLCVAVEATSNEN